MGEPQQAAWWKAPKGKAHEAVRDWCGHVTTQQRALREDTVFYLYLATNFNPSGSGYGVGGGLARMFQSRTGRMRYNLCKAGVDTASSLIAQNRTAPMLTTTAGDFGLARKAEQRSRVLRSQFYDLDVYTMGAKCFADGAITGTGVVRGYVDEITGLPKLERLLPNQLLVEQFDGLLGDPRSAAIVTFPAREVLMAMYPNKEEEVGRASGPDANDLNDCFLATDNRSDRVKVYEIWHLPSSPATKTEGGRWRESDGRHVIATSAGVLLDEPWHLPRFPLATYRYADRPFGYFGQGLVEALTPYQVRLSEIAQVVKACQDLCSTAIVAIEENSNVQPSQIDNLPGSIITYQRTPPQLLVWTGTPPDLANEYAMIKQEAFDSEGLSQQMVGGEKPKGLSSARAVRAADDVMARRHVGPTRKFEDFYLQIAQLISDLNDECASMDDKYMVTGRSRIGRKTFLTTTRWKDLQLPEGDVRVQMFPMNALSTTPAGKLSDIEDFIQGGFMSKPQALDLLEFPDVEAWQDLENAQIDLVHEQIERLLDGRDELPIEEQSLEYAIATVHKAFLVAYRMDAPPEIQDAFLSYLDYARRLQQQAQPPADPSMMAPAALNDSAMNAAQAAQQMPPTQAA